MKLTKVMSGFVCGLLFTGVFTLAHAGKEVGNGGDALVCLDARGNIQSVSIYDHYEALSKFKFKIDLDANLKTYDDKVNLALKRIERLNPTRASLYRKWYQEFFVDAEFLSGIRLVDIPDTADGFFPVNCRLEQIAIQRIPKFPGEVRYTIDKSLWDLMDADSQAGLILHELVLREAITQVNPHTNSRAARYFNSVVSSPSMQTATLKQYIGLLNLVEFEHADAQGGVPVYLHPIATNPLFYSDHIVSEAFAIPSEITYTWDNQKLPVKVTSQTVTKFLPTGEIPEIKFQTKSFAITIAGTSYPMVNAYSLLLDQNGLPSLLTAKQISVSTAEFTGTCSSVSFHTNGKIEKCNIANGSAQVRGQKTTVTDGFLVFTPKENLEKFTGVKLSFKLPDFKGDCAEATNSFVPGSLVCSGALGTITVQGLDFQITDGVLEVEEATKKLISWKNMKIPVVKLPEFDGSCMNGSIDSDAFRTSLVCKFTGNGVLDKNKFQVSGADLRYNLTATQFKLSDQYNSTRPSLQTPFFDGKCKSLIISHNPAAPANYPIDCESPWGKVEFAQTKFDTNYEDSSWNHIYAKPDGSLVEEVTFGKGNLALPGFKGLCTSKITLSKDLKLLSCNEALGDMTYAGKTFKIYSGRLELTSKGEIDGYGYISIQVNEPNFVGRCDYPKFDSFGAISSCRGVGKLKMNANVTYDVIDSRIKFDWNGEVIVKDTEITIQMKNKVFEGKCGFTDNPARSMTLYQDGNIEECVVSGKFKFLKNEILLEDHLKQMIANFDQSGNMTGIHSIYGWSEPEFNSSTGTIKGTFNSVKIGVAGNIETVDVYSRWGSAEFLHDGRYITVSKLAGLRTVHFHPNETVSVVTMSGEEQMTLSGGGKVFLATTVTFYDTGFVSSGVLSRDQTLDVVGSGPTLIQKGKSVMFDQNGKVTKVL